MLPLFTKTEWPSIAVMDIETTDWVNVVLLCHVDEYGERQAFTTIKAYVDWLYGGGFAGDHVWAHYGGKFDFRFILPELTARKIRWKGVWSGAQLIAITARDGKEITFVDSSRLMPSSLATIGKAVRLPKLDVDRDRIGDLSPEEVERYCFRDCDILLLGLQKFRDTTASEGADFAYTLASIASRYVRRGPWITWEKICHFDRKKRRYEYEKRNASTEEFGIPAYFGGRCEVFRRGHFPGTLYYYDIRSSYPYSMTKELPLYPKGFRVRNKQSTRKQLERCGVTHARVHVPISTYLPILPVYYQERLTFPTGDFEGTWTNIELLAAMDQGATVEITSSAIYEPVAFLEPFVRTFYKLREAAQSRGDEFGSYAFKILLNSLYGKLVETERKEQLIFGREEYTEAVKRFGPESIFPTEVPGVFTVRSFEQGKFRHVVAGSYVTAHSRLLLHRKLTEAIDKGGRVYYCDTDSIVTDVELETGDALGDLKLEHVFEWAEFVAPKVYRGKDRDSGETIYRVKGVPVGGYAPGEAEERWRRYTEGEDVDKDGISGLKTDLRAGHLEPRAVVLSRALRKLDRKRIHVGTESRPFVLDR